MHRHTTTRRVALRAIAASMVSLPALSSAQSTYPSAPVRLVMPFGPGGADALFRLVAERLQSAWGQPVILEYKPGAATVVAMDYVTKAKPDGLTIGMAGANLAVNPIFYKVPYRREEWRGVANLVEVQMALVARPDAPYNTLEELIAYGKANPGKVNYGIAGLGASYMGMEILMRRGGFNMLRVGFNSNGAAQTELLGGRLDVLVDPLVGLAQHINAGKMKVLAMLGAERYIGWEKYPAASESLAGMAVSVYYGLIVPRATPDAIVAKVEADISKIVSDPEFQKRLPPLGLSPHFQTARDFEKRSDADVVVFNEMAKTMNIVLQ
jgi:tripartite-type tricarboxylate transporter receptor subunit TctC